MEDAPATFITALVHASVHPSAVLLMSTETR